MIRFATVVATEPEWSRLVAFVGFLWSKWPTHGPTVYGTETNWFVTFAFPKYARANKWSNSPCNWVYDEWKSANHAYFQLNTYVLQSNKGNRLRKLQKMQSISSLNRNSNKHFQSPMVPLRTLRNAPQEGAAINYALGWRSKARRSSTHSRWYYLRRLNLLQSMWPVNCWGPLRVELAALQAWPSAL